MSLTNFVSLEGEIVRNGNLRDQDEIGESILQSQKKVLELLQMIFEFKTGDEAGSGE